MHHRHRVLVSGFGQIIKGIAKYKNLALNCADNKEESETEYMINGLLMRFNPIVSLNSNDKLSNKIISKNNKHPVKAHVTPAI